MSTDSFALSIKQPWAALLVHGQKTIEVRRWPTARRMRVVQGQALPCRRAQAPAQAALSPGHSAHLLR